MFRCNKNFPSLSFELISFDAGFDVQNNVCIHDTPLNLPNVHLPLVMMILTEFQERHLDSSWCQTPVTIQMLLLGSVRIIMTIYPMIYPHGSHHKVKNPSFSHFRTLSYSYAKISRGNLRRKYKLDEWKLKIANGRVRRMLPLNVLNRRLRDQGLRRKLYPLEWPWKSRRCLSAFKLFINSK